MSESEEQAMMILAFDLIIFLKLKMTLYLK